MLMHFEVHFSMNRQLELIYTRNPFDFKTHFSKILSKFRMAIWSTSIYTIGQTLVRSNYKARFAENRFWSRRDSECRTDFKNLSLFESTDRKRIIYSSSKQCYLLELGNTYDSSDIQIAEKVRFWRIHFSELLTKLSTTLIWTK